MLSTGSGLTAAKSNQHNKAVFPRLRSAMRSLLGYLDDRCRSSRERRRWDGFWPCARWNLRCDQCAQKSAYPERCFRSAFDFRRLSLYYCTHGAREFRCTVLPACVKGAGISYDPGLCGESFLICFRVDVNEYRECTIDGSRLRPRDPVLQMECRLLVRTITVIR